MTTYPGLHATLDPSRPVLVVEVADTSRVLDRHHKGSTSARPGLLDPAADFGWRYLDVRIFRPDAAVTPLALPEARIAVADLLP